MPVTLVLADTPQSRASSLLQWTADDAGVSLLARRRHIRDSSVRPTVSRASALLQVYGKLSLAASPGIFVVRSLIFQFRLFIGVIEQ